MADLFDVALSCWRLEKWINNAPVDRKMMALNAIHNIGEYLSDQGVEIIDYTGRKYDVTFPVIIINNDEITDDCIIEEMTKPVIIIKKENECKGLNGEAYVGPPVH